MMPFGVCDRCGSGDAVELFHHMAPSWDTEFLCWPCRRPEITRRIHPDSAEPVRDENRREGGQSSLFDYLTDRDT
jgi:hypothetical protein